MAGRPIITRAEVNESLKRKLAKEGRASEDPDGLSDAERFSLGVKAILAYKKPSR